MKRPRAMRRLVPQGGRHVYAKIEATNRATASLFAMQHGLFPEAVGWRAGTMAR